MRPDDRAPDDAAPDLVQCPRCAAIVVTVEMRTELTVYWRCVVCGYFFVQRIEPDTTEPSR
jgi:rubredoxin